MNTSTVHFSDLKVKLDNIDAQIERFKLQIQNLEVQREHLSYLMDNFGAIAGSSTLPDNQPTLLDFSYDSTLDTKSLILQILRTEKRPMYWNEVFNIFKNIKPNIAESTVRVSLSQMNRNDKFPVKLVQKGDDYKYILTEE